MFVLSWNIKKNIMWARCIHKTLRLKHLILLCFFLPSLSIGNAWDEPAVLFMAQKNIEQLKQDFQLSVKGYSRLCIVLLGGGGGYHYLDLTWLCYRLMRYNQFEGFRGTFRTCFSSLKSFIRALNQTEVQKVEYFFESFKYLSFFKLKKSFTKIWILYSP